MHATVPPSGGHSSKPVNVPTNTQQQKSDSESVQNSGTSSTSHSKGRKKDRGHQGSEPVKRERFCKPDDVDASGLKYESMIKGEIAKITERGCLTSSDGAEKLVNLMQLDRMERKINVSGRILIAEVIAATDRHNDCLGRILQLNGLPVLDAWLQEAHKGRTNEGSSPSKKDKAIEELLLSLLRALDKLPVDLHALQSCHIGKSVNHLRSHKNVKIHRKAKSLVDIWKKRVDEEMTKINDAKFVGSNQPASCPAKASFPNGSQTGNRHGGTTEGSDKAPVMQLSVCKTLSGKSAGPKDELPKVAVSGGSSEMLSAVKEDKSSSSSGSQNNSQCCSSDRGRGFGSWMDDSRSSIAGSLNSVKGHDSSFRRRSSSNEFSRAASGVLKESNQCKPSSLTRASALEKASQSGLTCEKTLDMPFADHGNNYKFIIKLPNPGRLPAPAVVGGSLEDPSVVADRHGHSDRGFDSKNDACRSHITADANAESWYSSALKEGSLGSDGCKPSKAILDDKYNQIVEDSGKPSDTSKIDPLSSGKKERVLSVPVKSDSFSPINALIESCAKYSEASVPVNVGDDIGVNLLASVATGEISKFELASPFGSPRASPAIEQRLPGDNEVRSRLSCLQDVLQCHVQSDEAFNADSASLGKAVGPVFLKNESIQDETDCTANICHKSGGDNGKEGRLPVSKYSKVEEFVVAASERDTKLITNKDALGNFVDCKPTALACDERKSLICSQAKVGVENVCTPEYPRSKIYDVHEAVFAADIKSEGSVAEETPSLTIKEVSEGRWPSDQSTSMPLILGNTNSGAADVGESETCKYEELEIGELKANINEKPQLCGLSTSEIDHLARTALIAGAALDHVKVNLGTCQTGVYSQVPYPNSTVQVGDHHLQSIGCKLSADLREEFPSSAESTSLSIKTELDASAKLDFDLNEAILDGNQGEFATSAPPLPTPVFLPTLPTHVNPASNSFSVPISAAAPAKGHFSPPESLLKSKDEHGLIGSAATSAFQLARRQKVLEMEINEPHILVGAAEKLSRVPLDIDLNIAVDEVLEEPQSTAYTIGYESSSVANCEARTKVVSGLDFDLNQVDGGTENGQFLVNTNMRKGVTLVPVKSASSGFPRGEAIVCRDFDLNNGPKLDEVCTEQISQKQHSKSNNNAPFLPAFADMRMNTSEFGGVPTWFPSGNSYPVVAIPSFFPDKGGPPFSIAAAPGTPRILGSVTSVGTFSSDIYRGPVLSSSPAMAFSPATSFPYAGFPFGSSFPLASISFLGAPTSFDNSSSASGSGFAASPSQLVGPTGVVPSYYARSFAINNPEGSSSGGSDNYRKWGRQNLDPNACLGGKNVERKDERSTSVSRQLTVASPQAFLEEHAKQYCTLGVGLKRKEPEGSWDADRSVCKQLAWQ